MKDGVRALPELMMRNANFMEEKCPKCGSFVLMNLWGQKWCWKIGKSCDWSLTEITTDRPLPTDEPKTKKTAKKTNTRKMKR